MDILKGSNLKRGPRSLEELEVVAYDEWTQISIKFIRHCISSMPERLAAVKRVSGLHTRY